MDLRKLLQKVETAPSGSPELDSEFVRTFPSASPNVTRSIDAAVQLIEAELPGWWWNCGFCALRNGASLYVPGSSRIRVNFPAAKKAPDHGSRPEHLRLLQDPKWGTLFDSGFHCDRGGTVPLAMLAAFLEAKIALTFVQPAASADKVIRLKKIKNTGTGRNVAQMNFRRRRAKARRPPLLVGATATATTSAGIPFLAFRVG